MFSLILASIIVAAPADTPESNFDTLVFCPQSYVEAMQPWFEHRKAQGHRIGLVTQVNSRKTVQSTIRETAKSNPLKFVLLVGDAIPSESTAAGVPTHYQDAVVNVHFGSEPEIATDAPYADLNDDSVPDIAIGRLSVANAAQLKVVVAKIIRYETEQKPGAWQRKLNFVAGLGGFGGVVDTLLESVTKKFLTDEIPASYETTVAYGSWQSPYCPDPREFRDEVIRQLNDGSLFWVYMGHGHVETLDYIRVPDHHYPILTNEDVVALRNSNQSPIAIFLACYTGAFDASVDSLGERLLRSDEGPVAVYAGSRVTMPYAMSVMGTEMMQQYFVEKRATLGELILHSKRESLRVRGKSGNRKMLDSMAGMFSPKPDLIHKERREHVALFNLLGDPLLRLPHAEALKLTAPKKAESGSEIEIRGVSPIRGNVRVELTCRRDHSIFALPKRIKYSTAHAELAEYNTVFQQANSRIWAEVDLGICEGEFAGKVQVPANCEGPCHIRIVVQGDESIAIGSSDLVVQSTLVPTDDIVPLAP